MLPPVSTDRTLQARAERPCHFDFHLGKPILVMLLTAVVTGAIVLTRSSIPRADLTVWTFVDSHARSYREGDPSLIERYRQNTGQSVAIKLIGGQGINVRLNAVFDRSDSSGTASESGKIPDLVEVEIGSVGRYFRPPLDHVGFLPLNSRLEQSGWGKRILPARLAPWTKSGMVFGIPHDVHPVSLTYRRDLFKEAGIDLPACKTWMEFQQAGLAFQHYWQAHGQSDRRAIELPSTSADFLIVMLLQRHINLIDADNRIHLNDPKVAQTIAFYARCVAGSKTISGDATPGENLWIRDCIRGDLCSFITPDWRAGYLPSSAPDLTGKLAMMPLPRFDPSDSPTATWGGTMIGIPRNARDPDKSWRLLEHLYFSPEGIKARQAYTRILPPLMEAWNDPIWHQADAYYSGQKIGELYVDLAWQLPQRHVTPFTALAQSMISVVLNRAVLQVKSGGEASLEADIQRWLNDSTDELTRRMEFGRFE